MRQWMARPQQGQIPVHRASMRWSSRCTLGRDQHCPEVFFYVQILQSQETKSQHGHGDMVMPSLPGTPFIMIQSQLIFELLVALLDPPPDLGQAHQTQETSVSREGGEPELRGGRR